MKKIIFIILAIVLVALGLFAITNRGSEKNDKNDGHKSDKTPITNASHNSEPPEAEHYYNEVYVDELFHNSEYLRSEDELDSLRDDISVDEFQEIEVGVTTEKEVVEMLGIEHGTWGSGFCYYVYFTKDKHIVGILYDYDGEEPIVDAVAIEEWNK